jgi:diguanylate cyclase (GGDEF)-like protein
MESSSRPAKGSNRREELTMGMDRQYTLGVLSGFHLFEGSRLNPFIAPILQGIQTAAQHQRYNVLISCGISRGSGSGRRFYPAWPEASANGDFLPVGPWNTDGLIVFNPIRFPDQAQYLQDLQSKGFPILYVGDGVSGPKIIPDNEGGIRQAMEHLVGHGHRQIAFIAGDESDQGDSPLRLKAYRQMVAELGLSDDPRLVEYGMHWEVGGYNAMRRLLQSGAKFTAVACSNDGSAFGVILAAREAGLRIPWDIAVTGFDDSLMAQAQIPPLTTVHYPLFETGYRAVVLIRKQMEQTQEMLPEVTSQATWLVARQSCGCLPEIASFAVTHSAAALGTDRRNLRRYKDDLAQSMMEALLTESRPVGAREIRLLCDRLVESFLLSIEDGDLSHFQIALIEVLQRIETVNEDAHAWQAAISVLRLGVHEILQDDQDKKRNEHAEDLLHQARTLISDSTRRRYLRMQLQQTYHDEAMGRLSSGLLSSIEEEQITSTLHEHMPQVGIRNGYIFFFEPTGADPMGGSWLHLYEKTSTPIRFESRKFPPPGLYPPGEPYHLALLPIFFQDELLGYAAFDGGNLDPLAIVVQQISFAVKSMELNDRVLDLSLTDSLTGLHNRRYFEILMQKEEDRSQRYNRSPAILMIDIDHFKIYNDAFGRLAGDEALREIARCISSNARRGLDVVARYGGEEFAVLLPETSLEGAWIVAEKIRSDIESDDHFFRRLTVSLGISMMTGDRLKPLILLEQAEKALSQAKSQGRNRTVRFENGKQEAAPDAA